MTKLSENVIINLLLNSSEDEANIINKEEVENV